MGAHVSVHIIWARHEHIFPLSSRPTARTLFTAFRLRRSHAPTFYYYFPLFPHYCDYYSYSTFCDTRLDIKAISLMRQTNGECGGNGSTAIQIRTRVSRQQYQNQSMEKEILKKRNSLFFSQKKNHLIFSSIWFSFVGLDAPSSTHSCRFFYAKRHSMCSFIPSYARHTFKYPVMYANVLSQTHQSWNGALLRGTTSIFFEINADGNVDISLIRYISRESRQMKKKKREYKGIRARIASNEYPTEIYRLWRRTTRHI